MRIAYISDPDGVNSNYRAYQPMATLMGQGHHVSYNRRGEPLFRLSEIVQSDVVHIHRYRGGEMQRLVDQLRERGVGIVWDNDDDLTNVPRSNPKYAKYSGARGAAVARAIGSIVRAADVVTTPSERLAASFRASGADDVRVIENYLPDAFPGTASVRHDGVVVAWLAGLEHQVDYQSLRLRETLDRLLDAHADLRISSIGLGLGLESDRYEHVKQIDFFEIPKFLSRADIGIAPLVDIPWNQARSNVKLKEYGAAGLAWLASPVGGYLGMGEREGGHLVPDDGWHAALDRLITHARERRKLAKRASKWAKGQTIGKQIAAWEKAYLDASERARARLRG
ncbi:glycosyltransferase [Conexibacter arvalis]|uniref:Glycosyltransferase involved in cell wall biosynthesis n=1 Tax=Conexibacter arvalis TaxID=912552 RepID=A0A840ICE7_9ACTN|nr:hypothetical protein [Conexibacter arvalis]MBB4661620.1 glycosyltransferase involved in cell wall biosynthesis [Conexibacter arvalis]